MNKEIRPWGSFEVLIEAPYYTVKRLVVKPGECLSLQLHYRRSEHWFVVSGRGTATVDSEAIFLHPGYSIDIHKLSKHRVENDEIENDLVLEKEALALIYVLDDMYKNKSYK